MKEIEERLNNYFAPEKKEEEIKKTEKEKKGSKQARKDEKEKQTQVAEKKDVQRPEEVTINALLNPDDVDRLIIYIRKTEEAKKRGMPKMAQRTIFQEEIESRRGVIIKDLKGAVDNDEKRRQLFETIESTWGKIEPSQEEISGIDNLFLYTSRLINEAREIRKGKMSRRIARQMAMEKVMSEFAFLVLSPKQAKKIEIVLNSRKKDMRILVANQIIIEAVREEKLMKRLNKILRREDLSEKDLRERIRKEIAKYASENEESSLASTVKQYGGAIGTYEAPEPAIQEEVVKNVLDIAKEISNRASKLSEEGQQVISSLVESGMSDVATTLLSQTDLKTTSDGKLVAEMGGGSLVAYFENNTPHILWKDPDGTVYPLSERPLEVAVDMARSKKINSQLDVDLLEESQKINRQLMLRVGKIDITDNTFMQRQEAEQWKRMLRVLLGKRKGIKDERLALEELGLFRNGRVDIERAKWMRIYLRFLQGTNRLNSTTFEQLAEVTRHWDAEKRFDIPKV